MSNFIVDASGVQKMHLCTSLVIWLCNKQYTIFPFSFIPLHCFQIMHIKQLSNKLTML